MKDDLGKNTKRINYEPKFEEFHVMETDSKRKRGLYG